MKNLEKGPYKKNSTIDINDQEELDSFDGLVLAIVKTQIKRRISV